MLVPEDLHQIDVKTEDSDSQEPKPQRAVVMNFSRLIRIVFASLVHSVWCQYELVNVAPVTVAPVKLANFNRMTPCNLSGWICPTSVYFKIHPKLDTRHQLNANAFHHSQDTNECLLHRFQAIHRLANLPKNLRELGLHEPLL